MGAPPGAQPIPQCHVSPGQDCPRRRSVLLRFSLQGLKVYGADGEVGAGRLKGCWGSGGLSRGVRGVGRFRGAGEEDQHCWGGRGVRDAGRGQRCWGAGEGARGDGEAGRGLRRGVGIAGVGRSQVLGSGMQGGGVRGAEGVRGTGEVSVFRELSLSERCLSLGSCFVCASGGAPGGVPGVPLTPAPSRRRC